MTGMTFWVLHVKSEPETPETMGFYHEICLFFSGEVVPVNQSNDTAAAPDFLTFSSQESTQDHQKEQ